MSLGKQVLSSSSLLISIKVIHRLLGLVSILLLARLLTPEDFAIVALVSITVHFFDILSNAGSEQYIIQKKQVDSDDLNTAWSLDIIIKSLLWLALVVSSGMIAGFFEQPALKSALQVAAFVLLINAAKNPGLFLLKQNLAYKRIFYLSVAQRGLAFVVAISLALQWRSFWALILADIAASLVFTIGSYLAHHHRPRLMLLRLRQQWGFSQWLLLRGVIGYTRSQIDTLLVSKFYPAALLGQYYMARDIAMLPSHNLLQPAIEPLLAAFRTAREVPGKLDRQVNNSLLAVALIAIPISFYLWFFPAPVIETLLGQQWLAAIPLLGVMSLMFLYHAFIQVLAQQLIVLQKVRALFIYDLLSLMFISVLLWLMIDLTLQQFALLRGVLGIITTVALLAYMRTFTPVMEKSFWGVVLPLVVLGFLMVFVTSTVLERLPEDTWPVVELLVSGGIFVGGHLLAYYLARRRLNIRGWFDD